MAAPAFVSAAVNAAGTQVAITFDQNVSMSDGTPTVTIGSRLVASPLGSLSASSAVVTGTVNTSGHGGPIRTGETVTVTSPDGVCVDAATGLLSSTLATNQAVTNSSTKTTRFPAPTHPGPMAGGMQDIQGL